MKLTEITPIPSISFREIILNHFISDPIEVAHRQQKQRDVQVKELEEKMRICHIIFESEMDNAARQEQDETQLWEKMQKQWDCWAESTDN